MPQTIGLTTKLAYKFRGQLIRGGIIAAEGAYAGAYCSFLCFAMFAIFLPVVNFVGLVSIGMFLLLVAGSLWLASAVMFAVYRVFFYRSLLLERFLSRKFRHA